MADEIRNLVKRLSKKYGSLRIAGDIEDSREYISTGNKALDLALEGGIALGYATELSGKSGSGKTLLMQLLLSDMQRKYDAWGLWLDREKAFYLNRAAELGINLDKTILVYPQDIPTVTDAEIILRETLESFPKDIYKFIAIDSISAFMKEGKVDKADMGKTAKSLHEMFRAVLPYIDNKTAFFFTNQRTFKIGVLFGDPETTTGGEAPKYYSSYRLKLDDKKPIRDKTKGGEIVGNWIKTTIIKTRSGPNLRDVIFPFYYKEGIPYYGGYGRLLWKRGYVSPSNKTDFEAFKRHDMKYAEERFDEFEIEEFIKSHPELIFDSYPEFNIGAESTEEEED